MSAGPTAGLYSEKLMDEWFVPVCSRELLARLGPLRSGADLKRFPLLRSSDEDWRLWLDPRNDVAWQERGTAFDDSLTILAAAEQGQGVALTRWALAAQDLADGRIAQASQRFVPCPLAYYFVCPEPYVVMPKVQKLLLWLREMAAEFPRPDGVPAEPSQKSPPDVARPRPPSLSEANQRPMKTPATTRPARRRRSS
jgi:LysR family transcriptional regulator, glycine cleavage system transcriptional activator